MAAEVYVEAAPADPAAWLASLTAEQRALVEKLNRRDAQHLAGAAQLALPVAWNQGELAYSPLAAEWPSAAAEPKAIYVDLANQVFGAYENGQLVRWGPVSSGAAASPTPAGYFHLNWHARVHISTVNADWRLPWYFNFDNRGGVGFHEYDLPGAAASHGCLRMLQRDAQWLYGWGQSWVVSADGRELLGEGTPVVIGGAYRHGEAPPWLDAAHWVKPIEPPPYPDSGRQ